MSPAATTNSEGQPAARSWYLSARGSTPQLSAKYGDLTGQGAGAAWKARGTFSSVGIVSSSLHHGGLTGAASGLASKAKGTHQGVAIDTIFAGRSVSDRGGLMSRFERGATPRSTTNLGQVCKRPKQRRCKRRAFGVQRFKSVSCPPLCGHGLRAERTTAFPHKTHYAV